MQQIEPNQGRRQKSEKGGDVNLAREARRKIFCRLIIFIMVFIMGVVN